MKETAPEENGVKRQWCQRHSALAAFIVDTTGSYRIIIRPVWAPHAARHKIGSIAPTLSAVASHTDNKRTRTSMPLVDRMAQQAGRVHKGGVKRVAGKRNCSETLAKRGETVWLGRGLGETVGETM